MTGFFQGPDGREARSVTGVQYNNNNNGDDDDDDDDD
jgi:hypothetical protein